MKNQKMDITKSPLFLMPILLLMWGSLAAVSKLLLNNLDSYQVLFYMYGIGVAVFFVIVVFKVKFSVIRSWKRSEFALIISCGSFTFLYDFFYLKSLERIPAVEASMLNYLFPIFIVLFAIPIHKEKLTVYKVLSIGMGFMGTVLLVTKGDLANLTFTNLKGDFFAMLAAVSWGLFTNLIKKNQKDMFLSTFFITITAFVLSVGAILISSEFILPHRTDFLGVTWLSISNIVLGFFLYFRALKYSPASLIASFTFFTPFVTLVFIVILLGEKLTITDYFAALLIISSVPIQKVRNIMGKKKRQLINKGNNV
ncbi:DMT family transporter [Neobacillus drentensis]|uniref:DMT family transporter n=1 Tax=Neobacillus drentensis TaxID=220684 RepID=UPI001F29AAA9|nr:DMT family transporter [Neobacillus drentensis]ULT55009.1 DMT family transporter [Neobacillus drentensis]